MSLQDPLIGQLVDKRFKVLERIGAGGMGTVYRARQLALDRIVALKTIHPSQSNRGDGFPKRFLLEASMCAKLAHSNTVRIFDFGRDADGTCYLAMEFLDGQPLSALLKEHGRLSARRAVHIAIQICDGLHEAHEMGIVHRDIKPANVMLVREGRDPDHVKVVDFGLVKQVGVDSGATADGLMVGSPRYMAPEQVRSAKDVDCRADLYSLGIVLYEMLTGKVPFTMNNMAQLMYAHVHEEPVRFADLEDSPVGVPDSLEQLVMSCLAKGRDARPATALEVGEWLETIAPELGPGPTQELGAQRRAVTASWLAVGAMTVAGGAVSVAVLGWLLAAFLVVSPVDEALVADLGLPKPRLVVGRGDQPLMSMATSPSGLRFRSVPAGAALWIDGARVGVTPKVGVVLAPGSHQIKLVSGSASVERTVVVKSGVDVGYTWRVAGDEWHARVVER